MTRLLIHPWEPGSLRPRPRLIQTLTSGRILGIAAGVATALVLTSGSAQAAGSSPGVGDTAGPKPVHRDAVVLRVEEIGGLLPLVTYYSRLPTVSIYSDGRVITEGPRNDAGPDPALPRTGLQQIKPADLPKLVRLALSAGVGSKPDLG